jgi:CheY-like chemotaxis protein
MKTALGFKSAWRRLTAERALLPALTSPPPDRVDAVTQPICPAWANQAGNTSTRRPASLARRLTTQRAITEHSKMNSTEPAIVEVTTRHSLLLVDDEPNILFALKRVFRHDGYAILTANSGTEALKLLDQHKVDVIITDQKMPVMSGVEFLRAAKIKSPDSLRLMLSTNLEEPSIDEATKECVIFQSIAKPWDNDGLRELIRKLVSLHAESDAFDVTD